MAEDILWLVHWNEVKREKLINKIKENGKTDGEAGIAV